MKNKYKLRIYLCIDRNMGMDTGTLVDRRDAGLVDGTYVHENNI